MTNLKEGSNKRNDNLRNKTISGFKWSFIDNVGKLGGQFVVGIILTRLLTPADFGLVGMITIFIVIGQALTNSGFGQALIQKKDADEIDFSTVFYFNILSSIFIYLVIYAATPLIAKFFHEPKLIPLVKVICLVFIVNAFGLIQSVHLEKKLEFKAPSVIGIISVFLAGVISIIMAFNGFGVWALVANTVLRGFFNSVLYWKISSWRPLPKFSFVSLKGLFSYGSKILVAGLVQAVFQNIYYLVIGRLFQPERLGYFTRATQFKDMPVNTIAVVVQKVTYPVFSTIQDDDPKIIRGYTQALRLLAAIALPLMVGIFITCRPLIDIVLGDKWLPVVPYLQIMSLYSWIYVVYTINNQIITIKGRSDYYLHIQIIDKLLIAISILLTYKHGITAMIYGHMVATILTYLVGSIYLKKVISTTILYQLKNILPFFVAAVLMLISSIPLSLYVSSKLIYLLSSASVGMAVYMLTLWIMKVGELKTSINVIKKTVKNFSSRGKND